MRSSPRMPLVLVLVLVLAAVAAGAVAGAVSASHTTATPPTWLTRPVVTGLSVGQTVTASTGTWSGTTPMTYYYNWIRSDSGDGTPIPAATSPTYTLTEADVGHRLFVQVKAENAAGPRWANSLWTPVVTGSAEADTVNLADGRVSVLVDRVALPDRLVVAAADFTPASLPADGAVSARVTVVDRLGHPVRGALVQVVALPFGSIMATAETQTDQEGVATITLTGRPQLLAHVPGGAIALSIRARKPGEDVLTGVTAQRLVQLRIAH